MFYFSCSNSFAFLYESLIFNNVFFLSFYDFQFFLILHSHYALCFSTSHKNCQFSITFSFHRYCFSGYFVIFTYSIYVTISYLHKLRKKLMCAYVTVSSGNPVINKHGNQQAQCTQGRTSYKTYSII